MSEDVNSMAGDELAAAQLLWGSVDSPWAHEVDESRFRASLAAFAGHDPSTVLSTHLPPIRGNLDRHLQTLSRLPSSTPWVGQDQAALEATLIRIAHT